jgi:hypothetical protein
VATSISQVRAGLEFRLKGISGLQVYAVWPDSLMTPAAIVRPMSGQYHQAMGTPGFSELSLEITFLAAASQKGLENGQRLLDDYLDDTGPKSIKAAIEGDTTLGGIIQSLIVTGWTDYGSLAVAEIDYLGATLHLQAWP